MALCRLGSVVGVEALDVHEYIALQEWVEASAVAPSVEQWLQATFLQDAVYWEGRAAPGDLWGEDLSDFDLDDSDDDFEAQDELFRL